MASWPLPGAIGVSPTGVGADLATASVDGRAEAVCWLEQAGNRSKSRTVTTTRCKACLTRIVVRWVGFRRTEDDRKFAVWCHDHGIGLSEDRRNSQLATRKPQN